MMAAVDTNVLVGLLEGEVDLANRLALMLDRLAQHGTVLIAPVVYAELLAAPGRPAGLVDALFAQTALRVDWYLEEPVWRVAGLAYRAHAQQRQAAVAQGTPRRILADFIIGAHAEVRQATLLTWDTDIYRTYFPDLQTVAP